MKNKQKNKYTYNKKNLKNIIEKRFGIIVGLIITLMTVIFFSLFFVQIINNQYYIDKLEKLKEVVYYSSSTPRGRIYDRNHKLIVDNVPVKVIFYKKQTGVSTKEEVDLAYKLADILSINYNKLTNKQKKDFYLVNNEEKCKNKITSEECQKLKERKLSLDDIYKLKIERIFLEELKYDERDLEAAYIYYLMNNGYSYSEKVIKNEDVTEEEYAIVAENIDSLKGVNVKLDWERVYLYEDVFRTNLGNVSTSSGIPYELKDYYLSRGYSLNDRVGTSYLEYQ